RYTWIRDSTFALWGLYTLGFDWEANDFFYFLADAAGGDADLQVMYGVGGERELTEGTLDHLSGYEGARPVRVGNGAYNQRQHDGARRVGPPHAARPVPPAGRRADPAHGPGDRRRADRRWLRPALSDRADRRWAVGRGGDVHDLLVLARLGARRDRRARPGAQ